MKYVVYIPESKSQRMKYKELHIYQDNGWGGHRHELIVLGDNTIRYEFSIPNDVEHVKTAKWIDGWTFSVLLIYQNSSMTREERYELEPELLGE